LDFAENCRFLGFRELNRPGLFERGVSALNVQTDILRHHEDVKRLRAAIANGAVETEKSICSRIEREGLTVRIGRHGDVLLVQGDEVTIHEKADRLIAARNAARKARDFKEADRIRDELSAMGIQLKDAKDPKTGEIVTTWEVRASGTTEVKR
jgi:cysteinyl-tRNA synthetase